MTRILIVEDEPGLRRALTINLRARNYDVTAVGDQSEFADTSDASVESRLGALCVKVFDAPSATNH